MPLEEPNNLCTKCLCALASKIIITEAMICHEKTASLQALYIHAQVRTEQLWCTTSGPLDQLRPWTICHDLLSECYIESQANNISVHKPVIIFHPIV